MSWCNEALCWYSKKETALLQEFGLTRSSWSGAGLAWERMCVYVCTGVFPDGEVETKLPITWPGST